MDNRRPLGKCRTSIYRRNMTQLKLLQQSLPYDKRLRKVPAQFFEDPLSFSHEEFHLKDRNSIGLNSCKENDSFVRMRININFCNHTHIERAVDNNDNHEDNIKDDNIEDQDGVENCNNVSTISNDSTSAVVVHDNMDYENINSMGDDHNYDEYVHIINNNYNDDDHIHIERDNNYEYIEMDCRNDDMDFVNIGRNDNDNYGKYDKNDVEDEDDVNEVDDDEDNDDDDNPYFDINHDLVANFPLLTKKNIMVLDYLLAILGISVKNHFSYEATLDIFQWINSSHNASLLPADKTSLWKMLGRRNLEKSRHYYCKLCTEYLGPKDKKTKQLKFQCSCRKCGPKQKENHLGHFLYIGLASQIKQLLKKPNIAESLKYRFYRKKKNIHSLEDIYDGQNYQELCKPGKLLEHWYNFSFTFNTDGCSVSESSGTSAWPIFIQINELSPHMRKKYILLAGIYVDDHHPSMSNFMRPFVVEMRKLFKTGITWKPTDTSEVTSRMIVITSSLDSPARSDVTCMTRFNGYFGCLYCYVPGKSLKRGKLVYPLKQSFGRLRLDSEIRADMKYAFKEGIKRNGIKGISPLISLPLFNIRQGVVVETMHAVFLGVVRLHTVILMTTTKSPYYIGNPDNLEVIDYYLLMIKPPSRRSRKPRSIKTYQQWKASEWRNWLEYAPVCLKYVLQEKYVHHLAMLSEAVHYLNGDSISLSQLNRAEHLLVRYVQLFEKFFGVSRMTSNVHLLTHLVETVRNWGPFWAHNAFVFEAWNKRIMDHVSSPNGRPDQIATRFLMLQFLNDEVHGKSISKETKDFLVKKLNIVDGADDTKIQDAYVVQGQSYIRNVSELESEALDQAGYNPDIICIYKKMQVNSIKFCSEPEDGVELRKSCDYFIYNEDNAKFGLIKSILQFRHNNVIITGIIVQYFEDVMDAFNSRHIREIKPTEVIRFESENTVIRPAIKMITDDTMYAVKLTNCWEID